MGMNIASKDTIYGNFRTEVFATPKEVEEMLVSKTVTLNKDGREVKVTIDEIDKIGHFNGKDKYAIACHDITL